MESSSPFGDGLFIFGGRRNRTWEGVGKREFPVAELFKPRGLKERSDRLAFLLPLPDRTSGQKAVRFFCCALGVDKHGAAIYYVSTYLLT